MLACPYCQRELKAMAVLNALSPIDFFSCVACAKLSERPKGSDGRPLPVVAPRPRPTKARLRRVMP
jgi:hypothetical protein